MTDMYLHMGLPKTATTTLQRCLFKHHSQIYYLGRDADVNPERGCISNDVHEFLSPLLWRTDKPFDPVKQQSMYDK